MRYACLALTLAACTNADRPPRTDAGPDAGTETADASTPPRRYGDLDCTSWCETATRSKVYAARMPCEGDADEWERRFAQIAIAECGEGVGCQTECNPALEPATAECTVELLSGGFCESF